MAEVSRTSHGQEQARTNIVFIMSDDQGPWAAGCYGNNEIHTPNIDLLASTGLTFDNFFCTSPVCSPARASLMTGQIPSRHGVHDWIRGGNMPPRAEKYLENQRCYTDVLAENGWSCALSGKWHLGDSLSPQHGFTHWFCHRKGSGSYVDQPMIRDGAVEQTEGYLTDVITDDAVDFLDRVGEEPFYLSVHYTAPHSPWKGHPDEIVASYDDCPFSSCPQEPVHPWAGPLTRLSYGNRDHLKGYFAAVTAMDLNIGRILETLERRNLRNNTLVIFTSDNGFTCGVHGFWGKGNGTFPVNMYESSVKVPMIVSQPGITPSGARTDAMMSQYDIFPTLLDHVGLGDAGGYNGPGRNFRDVWRGATHEAHEDIVVFDEYGPVRMIRTPEWKYVHRYAFGAHELYNMVEDPNERNNRIDDSGLVPVLKNLRGRLMSWFEKHLDASNDGRSLPVCGAGQLSRVAGLEHGYECFSDDRIRIDESGFPRVDNAMDLQEFQNSASIED